MTKFIQHRPDTGKASEDRTYLAVSRAHHELVGVVAARRRISKKQATEDAIESAYGPVHVEEPAPVPPGK